MSIKKPVIYSFIDDKPESIFKGLSAKLRKNHKVINRVYKISIIKDKKYSVGVSLNENIDFIEFKNICDEIIKHFNININIFYKNYNEPLGVKYTYSNIAKKDIVDTLEQKTKFLFIDDDKD
jgi:hypothetical protein